MVDIPLAVHSFIWFQI